jgi:molybdopterin-guanine dinucleotide biosynthesis protein A
MGGTLGVLVAGGAGARLGLGVPKALARLAGLTLLDRAHATLARVCDDVVVAAPAALALPLPPGARRVNDAPGATGPLAGLVAGLASAPCERAVVLGVDFPFIEPGALRGLLDRLGDVPAVIPAPGGFLQPLVAAYAAGTGAILAACHASGEGAPTRALRSLAYLRLDDAELSAMPGGLSGFFNLNTPLDLVEAERRMAERALSR